MNLTMPPLLLSLKPCYANLVFDGLKTVELRRRIAPHIKDRDVFMYVTSPIMALHGGFRVGEVWHGSPKKVWHLVSELAGIDKRDFDIYFDGQTIAYALEIKEVWKYQNPASLNTLRNRFSNFAVPQSWRYVRPEEYRSFRRMKRQIKEIRPPCPQYDHLQHSQPRTREMGWGI